MIKKLALIPLLGLILLYQNCSEVESIRLTSSLPSDLNNDVEMDVDNGDTQFEVSSLSTSVSATEFNEQCYLARYPDVKKNWTDKGLKTIDHWLRYGRYENRLPGCGPFNESCYLARYPDVVNNWTAKGLATFDHWVQNGIAERRKGDCDANNPYPQRIVGSGAKPVSIEVDVLQFAGAVKSLKWNSKEFINIYDHGRQLQSALQVDGYGECNNPTEAGSAKDRQKFNSSSKIISLRKPAPNVLSTNAYMAYWAWDHVTGACSKGRDTRVTKPTSGHRIEKTISIGVLSDPQIIDYKVKFVHPSGSYREKLVYEFLTGYLTSEFNKFWYMNMRTRKAVALTGADLVDISGRGYPVGSYQARSTSKAQFDPVIMSNQTGSHAMGVYVPASSIQSCGSKFHSYNMYYFNLGGQGPYGNATNKWSLAVEDAATSKCISNSTRNFQVYIAMGTVAEVQAKLLRLADTYR